MQFVHLVTQSRHKHYGKREAQAVEQAGKHRFAVGIRHQKFLHFAAEYAGEHEVSVRFGSGGCNDRFGNAQYGAVGGDQGKVNSQCRIQRGGKLFEYHKVYESVDFSRWDLLYDLKEGKPRNYYYDKIANKMGLGNDLVDSDQEVKPRIKETVIKTRTFSTISSYIWAGLGVALAAQDAWGEAFTNKMGSIKIFSKDFLERSARGFKNAVKELYQGGVYKSKTKAIAGRTFIFAAIASSVLGATLSMFNFFGKRDDVVKGKIDYDKDYTVG